MEFLLTFLLAWGVGGRGSLRAVADWILSLHLPVKAVKTVHLFRTTVGAQLELGTGASFSHCAAVILTRVPALPTQQLHGWRISGSTHPLCLRLAPEVRATGRFCPFGKLNVF